MNTFAQDRYTGTVRDAKTNAPIPAATIKNIQSDVQTASNANGYFSLGAMKGDSIAVSSVGYETVTFIVKIFEDNQVHLTSLARELEEVVLNTGYYSIPKERSTGSFVHLDRNTIERSSSPNLLDRLENISSGFQVARDNQRGETEREPRLRVRGVASIESENAPLIVMDGFPYEGDIGSIDPGIVETITFLRDAAAASIWGARAGNGVIVIVTKSGNQSGTMNVQFSSNLQLEAKPDLFYDRNRLPASTVMEIEQKLFDKNVYPQADNTPLPYYVELLYSLKEGLISQTYFDQERARLENTDVRSEAEAYLYREAISSQINLSVNGGGDKYSYSYFVGKNDDKFNLVGNENGRFTLQLKNGLKITENLRTDLSLTHVRQSNVNNGINLSTLYTNSVGSPSTYTRLMGPDGPEGVVRNYRWRYVENAPEQGLLDWIYRPLDELEQSDMRSNDMESRLTSNWLFEPLQGLQLSAAYQYIENRGETNMHLSKESYYVRDLVNRFTQDDGRQIIPYNDILRSYGNYNRRSHSGRIQANYDTKMTDHTLNALAGAEIRAIKHRNLPTSEIYNYDPELKTGSTLFDYTTYYPVKPLGSSAIPAGYPSITEMQERFVSYYSNVGYAFRERYRLSGSIRWDASNLFGVKTNQKGVPLWSMGGRWDVRKESFASNWELVNRLSLRASYGSSGNVNHAASALPTVRRGQNTDIRLPDATIVSVGNPSLRWEKVNTTNIAVDFGILNNSISGSIELYRKNADDLLGYDYVDPTTGLSATLRQMVNYAQLKTTGIDMQLNTDKQIGRFIWRTYNLLSLVKNEVVSYSTNDVLQANVYLGEVAQAPPVIGKSLDVLYALPWNGLSPDNGLPIVYLDGEESQDYRKYFTSFTTDELLDIGSRIPLLQGSTRQSVSYKGLELGFLVTWKGNYVFRTNSMVPGGEFQGNGRHHIDYHKRWQGAGDEEVTSVPANVETYDSYLDRTYSNSEILFEKGDHIRLQDVRLSYSFPITVGSNQNRIRMTTSFFANNLGILWRANKKGLDPDMPYALYPRPRTYNFGFNIAF